MVGHYCRIIRDAVKHVDLETLMYAGLLIFLQQRCSGGDKDTLLAKQPKVLETHGEQGYVTLFLSSEESFPFLASGLERSRSWVSISGYETSEKQSIF